MRYLEYGIVGSICALSVVSPAVAGIIPVGVPAPVIGLGIPALALFGLAYKRLRNRTKD